MVRQCLLLISLLVILGVVVVVESKTTKQFRTLQTRSTPLASNPIEMMSAVMPTVEMGTAQGAFNGCTVFAKTIMIATAAIPQEVLTILDGVTTAVDGAATVAGNVQLDMSADTNEDIKQATADITSASGDVAANVLMGAVGISTINSVGMKLFQVANDIELSCLACALTLKEDALTKIMDKGGASDGDTIRLQDGMVCGVTVTGFNKDTPNKHKAIAKAFADTWMYESLVQDQRTSHPATLVKEELAKKTDPKKVDDIVLEFIRRVLNEKQALKAAKAVWSFPGNCAFMEKTPPGVCTG